MKLSKPAAMNAFLFPGLGHIAAGWRLTGGCLVLLTATVVLMPFAAFIWGVLTPPDCWEGVGACMWQATRHGWSWTWPLLLVCVPMLVVVYVSALAHGLRLSLPGERPPPV